MKTAFLDTSGWFTALSPKEAKHQPARGVYREWMEGGTQLITTNLVVAEMQILLMRYRGTDESLRFLDSLYQDPAHNVISSTGIWNGLRWTCGCGDTATSG